MLAQFVDFVVEFVFRIMFATYPLLATGVFAATVYGLSRGRSAVLFAVLAPIILVLLFAAGYLIYLDRW
jgi:Flp pilus assembly protein TadG